MNSAVGIETARGASDACGRFRTFVRRAVRSTASALAATVLIAALALTATADAQTRAHPLTIYAASSLTQIFQAFDEAQTFNFAGSNALETQIRNGAPADIFASAAPVNTQRLFAAGLVQRPVTFTANRLALIVPKSNPAGIKSVYDLKTKDVKLVIANAAVPVGVYTRTVLKRMALTSVLSKVVSQESDVKAVTGKVALGQADAGFVYVTDARAVSDQVTVIRIPASAQPRVRYEIAVVSRSGNKVAARAWINKILSVKGQAALKNAGFLPLPKAPS
jgi:molybdate transport system substrate-binding protein